MDYQKLFDRYYCEFRRELPSSFSDGVVAFITAQSALETGWFNSYVFLSNNNCFGMRLPRSRVTLSVGLLNGHAVYKSIYDSLHDYLLWLVSFGFNQLDTISLDRFYKKLSKSSYNPSDSYASTILQIYNKYYEK